MRLLIYIVGLLSIITACKQERSSGETDEASLSLTGKQLAHSVCASCHLLPQPEELDRKSWDQVLPRMGYMLGIYHHDSIRQSLLETGLAGKLVHDANVFPEKPVIEAGQLKKIAKYYLEAAPDELEVPAPKTLPLTSQFSVITPSYRLSPPSATLVKLSHGQLWLGDANKKSLMLFDQNLKLQQYAQLKEGVVDARESEKAIQVLMMGSFSPTDEPSGGLFNLDKSSNRHSAMMIDQLQRPVNATYGDLNSDGIEDVVICEFGKWTGSLSWYCGTVDGDFRKEILRNKPGAIKAYIRDMNNDALPDVVALFGQGDEGIFLFENQGNGKFIEKCLLRFPASYGSSFFNLQDLNGDGQPEILYTAGDNADFKPILKPYHGIRIFSSNDGQFEETFFYPLDGAYKVIAEDFDQDGDKDLAAIAFFPDFNKPTPLGFVYLENDGTDQYQARTIPDVEKGRWIVMDAGDIDQDGDTDLVLGSLAFEVVDDQFGHLSRWVSNGIPFLLLKNNLIKTETTL